jgi:type II secretory ATPase GspE/PulE/Tfp pilus assembly ATPase PilB-like protein
VIYRSEFCDRHGVALLEEREHAVVVGHWKPVASSLREALSLLHGKSVALQQISRRSPEAQLALHAPAPEHPTDDPVSTQRTHNLPPLEAYLRQIITKAAADGATDVSIWKWNNRQWRISARIGGRLTSAGVLDPALADRLLRHLVVRANLDVLDRISPQDGTIAFPWLPGYRVRVAVVGDRLGRYVALRFLRRTAPDLAALGYRQRDRCVLIAAATALNGLVLFAGPTGSGKTTGMAALLAAIVAKNRKVVSLEDPVEYRIPGAVQIERAGGTLRGDLIAAALRQDPDVLAFGEIRREAHARQLEEAVLSGHLVVSSVHADDASGVLRRVVSLGMSEPVVRRYCRVLCRQRLERSITRQRPDQTVRLHAHVEEYPWNTPR